MAMISCDIAPAALILIVIFATLTTFALSLRTAMAADAVSDIRYAFFGMFRRYLRGLVGVAAITSIARKDILLMARRAVDVVRAVKFEIAIMSKGCWLPPACSVTLRAPAIDFGMELILGFVVTGGTHTCDGGL
ncbi:MAG: hypothetical protein ABL918_02855 [Chakrabartia sp.]